MPVKVLLSLLLLASALGSGTRACADVPDAARVAAAAE